MAWNEQLPEWNATGVEPPASKKNEGWKPDDRPPADWFNWLFNRAYKVMQEIRIMLGGHVDAAAPHSGHETPAGATAKASAAETNAKSYTDNHAESKATHGIGSGYYIAKTSRSDQLPAYADVQDKPSSFPPSTHTHPKSEISDFPASMPPSAHKSTHASGGSDALSPADIGAATAAQGETADTAASDLAAHLADIATLETLGHVKPDGTSITIDSNGVLSVINNTVVLYDEGDENVSLTGGWIVGASEGTGTQQKNTNNLELTATKPATEDSRRTYVNNIAIDFSQFKTLKIEQEVIGGDSPTFKAGTIRISANRDDAGGEISQTIVTTTNGITITSIDATNINGSYYIKLMPFVNVNGTTGTLTQKVYRVWGEK